MADLQQGIEGPLEGWGPGRLPASWLERRMIGEATIERGEFADIGHSTSLAHFRSVLAARLVHYQLFDLDAAAIRMSTPRSLTQEISRLVFESVMEDGHEFAGIHYLSRLGDNIRNWAIFEAGPALFAEADAVPLHHNDPDLQKALELLHIELV